MQTGRIRRGMLVWSMDAREKRWSAKHKMRMSLNFKGSLRTMSLQTLKHASRSRECSKLFSVISSCKWRAKLVRSMEFRS
jgi:hypothetical protein